jgi:hypothetical protein
MSDEFLGFGRRLRVIIIVLLSSFIEAAVVRKFKEGQCGPCTHEGERGMTKCQPGSFSSPDLGLERGPAETHMFEELVENGQNAVRKPHRVREPPLHFGAVGAGFVRHLNLRGGIVKLRDCPAVDGCPQVDARAVDSSSVPKDITIS